MAEQDRPDWLEQILNDPAKALGGNTHLGLADILQDCDELATPVVKKSDGVWRFMMLEGAKERYIATPPLPLTQGSSDHCLMLTLSRKLYDPAHPPSDEKAARWANLVSDALVAYLENQRIAGNVIMMKADPDQFGDTELMLAKVMIFTKDQEGLDRLKEAVEQTMHEQKQKSGRT